MERAQGHELERADEPEDAERDYHSDVTPKVVERMREQARPQMEDAEWEQVDGFGTIAR